MPLEANLTQWIKKYLEKIDKNSTPDPQNTCIMWTASTKNFGGIKYGRFYYTSFDKQSPVETTAHRAMFMLKSNQYSLSPPPNTPFKGPWDVSHLCHNSLCVNIDHLSYEPHIVNMQRNICKREKHCCGHPEFSECVIYP